MFTWPHVLVSKESFFSDLVENISDLCGLKRKGALEPCPPYLSFIKKERKEASKEGARSR